MSEALQLVTHTESKAVLLTPELDMALPRAKYAMKMADASFVYDRREYLERLEQSQFMVKTKEGPEVACSLLMNNGQQSDELLVMFAPFADRNPKSSAETMYRYISGDPKISKTQAKPNTWNQTTKSAVTADVLEALGHGMPVLTIYAPVPTGAYNAAQRKLFAGGDFMVSGRLAMEAMRGAIDKAQALVHGMNNPHLFRKLHLAGASLGASNAVGAAEGLTTVGFDVQTLTTQELVLSPKSLPDLAKRFTVGGIVGEASTTTFHEDAPAIAEPELRQAIDHKGSEIIGMNLRMLQGASKYIYMKGMTKPQPTINALERLVDEGVDVTVATADNSAMSDKARQLVPEGAQQIHIAAQEGAKLGHIVDEHVALSALVIALNITKNAK